MNPVFAGTIEKGKLKLDNPHKYLVRIAALEGKKIELILRQQKSKRSLNQNAWYWGCIVEILSNHLGYDKDEMHFNLKVKFASSPDIERPGFFRTESTSKMDTKRFLRYCEDVQRWAAEFLQVYIPDPNQTDYPDADIKNII